MRRKTKFERLKEQVQTNKTLSVGRAKYFAQVNPLLAMAEIDSKNYLLQKQKELHDKNKKT
tara:strand:+ start:73 stop:255 length:183 start_codon:yes stop_codon:yes gene_type:complete